MHPGRPTYFGRYLYEIVTLPEPVKLREADAKEDAKLSEFQEELVQMAAALKGDHRKDTYPHKLVEDMNVSDASDYVHNAFNRFLDECQKAKTSGTHDASDIVVCPPTPPKRASSKKSFAQKMFSCLICDNWNTLSFILSIYLPAFIHLPSQASWNWLVSLHLISTYKDYSYPEFVVLILRPPL